MKKLSNIVVSLFLALFALGSCDDSGSSSDPPKILEGGGVFDAYVGIEFSAHIIATDSDTQNLQFSFSASDITSTSQPEIIQAGPQGAYFKWTPTAQDAGEHNIDLIVSDGKSEDKVVLTLNVKSSTGSNPFPVFIEPLGSGTTLDLSKQTCLDVDIIVEDADSAEVDIYMEEPITEGYELHQDGGEKEAVFSWCPTDKQISESDRYTLNLAANDRDGHVTHKRFVIILRRDLETNCAGDPPVINISPETSIETLENINIEFNVSDASGLSSPPVLYYTFANPQDPQNLDLSAFVTVTSTLKSGDETSGTYQAEIPNPILNGAPGDSTTLYYFIEAEDNDDLDGECDHRTVSPESGVYQLTVIYPSGTISGAPLCTPCQADVQCGGENDACVYLSGGNAYCLVDCNDDPDVCPTGTVCSQDALIGLDGLTRKQCVPMNGVCPIDNQCTPDSYEDNDVASSSLPAMSDGLVEDLTLCIDPQTGEVDDDWYKISLNTTTLVLTEIYFQQSMGDCDLQLFDSDANSVGYSISVTNDESILKCLPAGDYYLHVFSWESDISTTYDLNIEMLPDGCCTDDEYESNNSYTEALPVENNDVLDNLSICEGDQDWWAIDLNAGQTLTVEMLFDQNDSGQDIDLYLYDTDGTTNLTPCCDVNNGQSSTSDEQLVYTVDATGTYYVQVVGYNNSENHYYMISFFVTD